MVLNLDQQAAVAKGEPVTLNIGDDGATHQNSQLLAFLNLTIFGEHDQRVVEQLARCVAQEDGSVGVLCADGHLGYSQARHGTIAQLASAGGVYALSALVVFVNGVLLSESPMRYHPLNPMMEPNVSNTLLK